MLRRRVATMLRNYIIRQRGCIKTPAGALSCPAVSERIRGHYAVTRIRCEEL